MATKKVAKKADKKAALKKGPKNFINEINAVASTYSSLTARKVVCKVWPDTGRFECRPV